MNQLKALRETVETIAARMDAAPPAYIETRRRMLDDDLNVPHLQEMLARAEADHDPTTGKRFNAAKLGRWLGWAQAAGVALGALTLDDCKGINRRHAG